MGECWQKWNDYFERKGNMWLIIVTTLEILFYVAFSIFYGVKHHHENDLTQNQIYRFLFAAVLILSLVYFLWHSVRIN